MSIIDSNKFKISIHAPVKGATTKPEYQPKDTKISIHAPVKGATTEAVRILQELPNFNPRSREGSDYLDRLWKWGWFYFNPRSREGSDGRLLIWYDTL